MHRCGILLLLLPGLLAAGQWPQFRGPQALAVDKDSGDVVWKTDRPEVKRGYATSGVFLSEDGAMQLVARVNLLQDKCVATPAIADGRLFIRTEAALYSFGK